MNSDLTSRESSMVNRILQGDLRAGARLLRWIDDRDASAERVLRVLFPHTGQARIIGITGNPGSGKSTLTSELISLYRRRGHRVGVVCVDPSSPFTGGAILGDRIRMIQHATDEGVFIRSLATRGALGGLSRSTHDTVLAMDAMGYDPILVETVGVGQDEIDVVRLADTNVVVVVPGMGDDIQAIKAGILEIADVFVVNKADQPLTERAIADLRALQALASAPSDWVAPIVKTVAIRGEGVADVITALESHLAYSSRAGSTTRRASQREENALMAIVEDRLRQRVLRYLASSGHREFLLDSLQRRAVDPYTAADEIVRAILVPGIPDESVGTPMNEPRVVNNG